MHPFISCSGEKAFCIQILSALCLLSLVILSPYVSAAYAGQVTVTWNPEPEVGRLQDLLRDGFGELHGIPGCGKHDKHCH